MLTLAEQRRWLETEFRHERDEFRRDMEAAGVERRVRRGDAWRNVRTGKAYYNALNEFAAELFRPSEAEEIEHNFEYGRSVCFFSEDAAGMLTYLPFTATVSFAEEGRMVVILPSEAHFSQIAAVERLGVALSFDETTYRLMFDALAAVQQAKGDRLAYLRDLFHTPAMKPQRLSTPQMPPRLPWLNASQEQAVHEILQAKDAFIVHGPPGTGKTTTLVWAVDETLRRETQVLVCAQSNAAVDWISAALARQGISVLRIGNPTRVSREMLDLTYERRFEAHAAYPDLWKIRRTIRQLYSTPRRSRSRDFHEKVARLRDRADAIELRIRTELFQEARVVACTLAGSASPLLTGQRFHTLFVDEAAQALEAATWIALRRADRVILAGDHHQLPPTVKSPAAQRAGLGITLMERLAQQKPEAVRLLTVQYRMRPELMRFSSQEFYGGRLTAAAGLEARSWLDTLTRPLVWLDSTALQAQEDEPFGEEFVANGFGRINRAEADAVLRALHDLVAEVGMSRLREERTDIGIISPYRAQVQHLRRLVKRDEFLRPLRQGISINTVDAFQGQERDVIILSLVRDNADGQIGFLRDLRRTNVAITRARHKLVIIGAADTLCRHPFYRRLKAYADACEADSDT